MPAAIAFSATNLPTATDCSDLLPLPEKSFDNEDADTIVLPVTSLMI